LAIQDPVEVRIFCNMIGSISSFQEGVRIGCVVASMVRGS